MRILFASFITTFASHTFAQTFQDIQDDTLDFSTLSQYPTELFDNMSLMINEDFDSIDYQIIARSEIIGAILLENTMDGGSITYGDLYEDLLDIKTKVPNYDQLRSISIIQNKMKPLPADPKNWESDRLQFEAMGMDSVEIIDLGNYIKRQGSANITYEELMLDYYEMKEEEERAKRALMKDAPVPWENSMLFNKEETFEMSRNASKPILLYFTGYNCVNCRKMEHSVMKEPEIFPLLSSEFIFVSLYVDDRQELPASEQKSIEINGRKKDIRTVGDANAALEMMEYNRSTQPLYVVIDADGNVLGQTTYMDSRTPSGFKEFLEESLEEYHK